MLLTLLSGAITTMTFTLMMQCSRAAPPGVQTTHYTLLATMEVIGKLVFSAICGWLVELVGYRVVFLLLSILSAAVLLWINRCPSELEPDFAESVGTADKAD